MSPSSEALQLYRNRLIAALVLNDFIAVKGEMETVKECSQPFFIAGRKKEKQSTEQLASGYYPSKNFCTAKRNSSGQYADTKKTDRNFRILQRRSDCRKTVKGCHFRSGRRREIEWSKLYKKRFGNTPTDDSNRSAFLRTQGPRGWLWFQNTVLQIGASCVCTEL